MNLCIGIPAALAVFTAHNSWPAMYQTPSAAMTPTAISTMGHILSLDLGI
jgi:signal peptidase I